jgi:hypothetical protein
VKKGGIHNSSGEQITVTACVFTEKVLASAPGVPIFESVDVVEDVLANQFGFFQTEIFYCTSSVITQIDRFF